VVVDAAEDASLVIVELDGSPAAATFRHVSCSAWAVYLSSCLPEYGIELHSSYLGAPGAQTRALHLHLARDATARTDTSIYDPDEMPVWRERHRCLVDHLLVLHEQLEALGHTVRIDTPGETLVAIDA
jgi:hypothetical protein